MYELVNTSLPNGLIAGTHGFATVAMTRGVSDVLRERLEALCAYTHRTSIHDETYYQQNPVNWFHVILPKGEHVVGRVAPSDFDYTGRTNRLAKIRVFPVSEMPTIGGAEILIKGKDWFSQAWQGEPRYLEEDKNTSNYLRSLNPSQDSSASAWEALFGKGGSYSAQQVSWLLEKNLTSGGKTIYFKTSTAWDVTGEKLLRLFLEVINLLPVEMRSRVTFSTYSVSPSGGIGFHLRGIYDRDKIFDATATTQVWIDCEQAKIVHAEMLPISRSVRPLVKTAVSAPQVSITQRTNRPLSTDGGSNTYHNLVAPPTKGPDLVVIGLIVACVVVLLTAGGLFFWMMSQNKQQMEESGAATAVEAENNRLADENVRQIRLAEEEHRAEEKNACKDSEKESAERGVVVRKSKEDQEVELVQREHEKKVKIAAETDGKQTGRNTENHEQIPVFMSARVVNKGVPPKPKTGLRSELGEPQKLKVFYYADHGVTFTNEVAGFKRVPNPVDAEKIIEHILYVRKSELKLTPLEDSPVVLWLIDDQVWFDWGYRDPKMKKWFENEDCHDLQEECFGKSENVFTKWNNTHPVTYRIIWGDEEGQSAEWASREFTIQNAVKTIFKAETERLETAMKQSGEAIDENQNKIKNAEAILTQFDEYSVATNKLTNLKSKLSGIKNESRKKSNGKKGDKETKKAIDSRQDILEEEIKKQEGVVNAIKKVKVSGNDIDIGLAKTNAESVLKELRLKSKELQTSYDKKKEAYEKAVKNPNREKEVRGKSFRVLIKGVN